MAKRKGKQLPQFKYATIADCNQTLLLPERIELFWKLDESVSFSLPEGCIVHPGDEVWLTCGSSERLVGVASVQPGEPGKMRVEAKPADPYSFLHFRK